MKLENENGYSLVLVLLTLTIFMLFTFSFLGQAASSTKQNKIIENKTQSIAIAEMGIIYFQNSVENAFWEVKNFMSTQREQDIKNKVVRQPGEYLQMAINQLTNKINDIPPNGTNSLFTIDGVQISPNNGKVIVKFNSIGKESVLTATMNFDLNEIQNSDSDDKNGNIMLPDFNKIKKPDSNDVCVNPKNIINCKEVIFNEDVNIQNELNNISNKTIYTTNKLLIKNANSMENMKIHVESSFDVDKNMNQLSNSIIEVKSSGDFSSNLKIINNSEIYFGGTLTIDGHLELDSGSLLYINGNASIGKHLKISDSQSKVCVKGSLSVDGKSVDSDRVIVFDKDNPNRFYENCGIGNSALPDLDWGNMKANISIKYY